MRFDPSNYIDVQQRINTFWQEHPDGAINTRMEGDAHDFEHVVFRAEVYQQRGDARPTATGYAAEMKGSGGANNTSWHENGECVPLSAEILTRRGWKHAPDLRTGEDVLAYDIENDRTVWTPLRAARIFHDAPLISMSNKHGFRVRCTPDHRWVVSTGHSRTRKTRLRHATALASNDAIVTAAPGPDGDHALSPSEAAILGWWITDGSIRWNGGHVRAQIGQTKAVGVTAIRELVSDLATESTTSARTRTFPTGRTYETKPGYRWDFPAFFTRDLLTKAGVRTKDDVPALVTRLSAASREAMFAAMMMAEANENTFYQNPGPVLDAFQILATLNGHALGSARPTTDGDTIGQTVRRFRTVRRSQLDIQPDGVGVVWCPTTDYSTWVMRQDGVVAITGNTSAIGRALANMGYATTIADRPSRQEMEKVNRHTPPVTNGQPPQQQQEPVSQPTNGSGPVLTENQRKALWAISNKRWGANGERNLHTVIQKQYRVESITTLSKQQASQLIDAFQQNPGSIDRLLATEDYSDVPALMDADQDVVTTL